MSIKRSNLYQNSHPWYQNQSFYLLSQELTFFKLQYIGGPSITSNCNVCLQYWPLVTKNILNLQTISFVNLPKQNPKIWNKTIKLSFYFGVTFNIIYLTIHSFNSRLFWNIMTLQRLINEFHYIKSLDVICSRYRISLHVTWPWRCKLKN